MATPCHVDLYKDAELPTVVHNQPVTPQEVDSTFNFVEYDFIEQPSQDFFCPVTSELLINPYQTRCCGNHLSQEAVERLLRDNQPCPMCTEAQLNSVPDTFYKRKVSEIRVRCPYKKSGCEWVGEVGSLQQHSQSCLKRPWRCQYCDLATTYDIGPNEHIPKCTMYPEPCPNSCEIGTVPHCYLKRHKMVCPLEIVSCRYADVGCDVKVCRRDLARHMEEGQQQHLLSATLLNLQLTRSNTKEIERLNQIVEEKDQVIVEKDHLIAEKDQQIGGLQKQLKAVQNGLLILEQRVRKCGENSQEHLKKQDRHIESVSLRLYQFQGFTYHQFTLREFSKCQAQGGDGNWYSEPFYSPPKGYKFKLNIKTNGYGSSTVRGTYMSVLLYLVSGDHNHDMLTLSWPVNVTAHIQLVNQLGDYDHHEVTISHSWKKRETGWGINAHYIEKFIELSELGLSIDTNSQYLKGNCLQFEVYIKTH